MAVNDTANKNLVSLVLDLRIVSLLLLAVIAAMFIIWKPWSAADNSGRTIEVTGEATITAEPDEFVFYPAYEAKNADRAAALAELTKKTDEVVAGVKKIGVSDNKIKTDASGYDFPVYRETQTAETTYTSRLTITIDSRDMAQKVQDYLVSTTPTGSVSPRASFSDSKRRELENKARDEATKEARAKADQSAENLGFKVGKVKAVEDGAGFGDVMPLHSRAILESNDALASSGLGVQPGENEFNYSVKVTYFLR